MVRKEATIDYPGSKSSASWRTLLKCLNSLRIERALHYVSDSLLGPTHCHEHRFHLTFLKLGRGTVVVDGESFELMPNCVFFIRPGQEHGPLKKRQDHFDRIDIKFSASNKAAQASVPDIPTVIRLYESAAIQGAMERLLHAHLVNPTGEDWLARIRLAEILLLLTKTTEESQAGYVGFDNLHHKICEAAKFISLNYALPMSVQEIAERSRLSPVYFASSFRRIIGVSPIEFLIRTRLHHARELLRDSTMPVKTIAAVCGFRSLQYFSRIFSKREGRSPIAFRQGGKA